MVIKLAMYSNFCLAHLIFSPTYLTGLVGMTIVSLANLDKRPSGCRPLVTHEMAPPSASFKFVFPQFTSSF